MNVSAPLRFPVARFLSRFCPPRNEGARSAALALLAVLAAVPSVHAQTAHFSGSQSIIPTSSLNQPEGIAVDESGNVYVTDSDNGRVLKETLSAGTFTESTIASGFMQVTGIAVDSVGDVYFGDAGTEHVYKETPSGNAYTQSVLPTGSLSSVAGIAVDGNDNVYVVDFYTSRVLKETLSGGTYTENSIGSGLLYPKGVAVDATGNVYIADTGNNRILKETLSSGSYTQSSIVSSGLGYPWGLAVDGTGNVFIADPGYSRVLEETPSGGSYTQSTIPTTALANPLGIAVDSSDNLYIVKTVNGSTSVVKESTPASAANLGTVNVGSIGSPLTAFFTFDTAGNIAAPALLTQGKTGLDFTDEGTGSCTTNGTSYTYSIGDSCTVDVIFAPKAPGSRYGAAVLQTASGNTIATGYVQGTGAGPQVYFSPGIPSTLTLANNSPYAIATDASGNLYIAETGSAGTSASVVKQTWTGSGYTESVVASGLNYPVGVAVDGAGNVYIADQDATQVLKETPLNGGGYAQTAAFTNLGNVEGVAVDGSGNVYIGSLAFHLLKETLTAGSYTQSTIDATVYPFGIAVDVSGNIYFTQNSGTQIFKETLANGVYSQSVIASGLGRAYGVALDGSGNVYAADIGNGAVVQETPSVNTYTPSTVASGLNGILGVAVDSKGNVYASSAEANAVWALDLSTPPSLVFANTSVGATSGDSPQTVTIQNAGNAALSFPIPSIGDNPSIASNFTLDSSAASACPLIGSGSSTPGTLPPGASCTLPISFAPTAAGALSGSLVLTDNNLNTTTPAYATQIISLSGTATAATPTITWEVPAAITYGTALGVTQLNATSTVVGTFAYTPAFGTVLTAGTHTLAVTFTPSDTTDYTTATATTTITVNPISSIISWATPAPITYGTLLGTQLNATSTVAGTFAYSPTFNTLLDAGSHSLSVTFTPSDPTDYTTATATTTIVVSPAAPQLLFTPISGQIDGSAPFAVSASSPSPGLITYAVVSGPATISGNMVTLTGTGSVVLSASQAATANYTAATTTTSFPVGASFTLGSTAAGSSGTSASVAAGAAASFKLMLTPSYGATFLDPVTFTAAGLPPGATAVFSPTTVAAGSAPTSVVLTIQTSNSQTARNRVFFPGTPMAPITLGFLLFPLLGMRMARKRIPCLLAALAAIALSLGAASGLSGCAGGSNSGSDQSTTTQSYTVVVTAKDVTTGAQSSTNLTLTVQ